MKNDYLITRVKIVGPEFRLCMFGAANIYKKLTRKCVYMDNICHAYFQGTGKISVTNCY